MTFNWRHSKKLVTNLSTLSRKPNGTKRLLGRKPIPKLSIPGRLRHIVDNLFPVQATIDWPIPNFPVIFLEITPQEVKDIPKDKAPGPDRIPDLVQESRREKTGDVMPDVQRLFEGRIISFSVDMSCDQLLSFRPIYFIKTDGKFIERIIKQRLEKHIDSHGELSEYQFGFRRGRSTVDAVAHVMDQVNTEASGPLRKRKLCAMIALDVANAFNSARWEKIMGALKRFQAPEYLLRILQSYFGEGDSREVMCGVVLGPLLCNIIYDDLLRTYLGFRRPCWSRSRTMWLSWRRNITRLSSRMSLIMP